MHGFADSPKSLAFVTPRRLYRKNFGMQNPRRLKPSARRPTPDQHHYHRQEIIKTMISAIECAMLQQSTVLDGSFQPINEHGYATDFNHGPAIQRHHSRFQRLGTTRPMPGISCATRVCAEL